MDKHDINTSKKYWNKKNPTNSWQNHANNVNTLVGLKKSLGVTKNSVIHYVGAMNICTKCDLNSSSSGPTNQPTNQQTIRPALASPELCR